MSIGSFDKIIRNYVSSIQAVVRKFDAVRLGTRRLTIIVLCFVTICDAVICIGAAE